METEKTKGTMIIGTLLGTSPHESLGTYQWLDIEGVIYCRLQCRFPMESRKDNGLFVIKDFLPLDLKPSDYKKVLVRFITGIHGLRMFLSDPIQCGPGFCSSFLTYDEVRECKSKFDENWNGLCAYQKGEIQVGEDLKCPKCGSKNLKLILMGEYILTGEIGDSRAKWVGGMAPLVKCDNPGCKKPFTIKQSEEIWDHTSIY